MSDAESQEGLGEEQQSSPATSVVGQQHDPPPYVPEVALPEMGLRYKEPLKLVADAVADSILGET